MRGELSKAWTVLGYVPVTVFVVFGVGWYFQHIGLTARDVFASEVALLNPLWYVLTTFIHSDWAHFWGNMRLFVPFGVLLTLLTSNRHVALIVFVPGVLAGIVSVAAAPRIIVGASGEMLALVAATLVRSVGVALSNASEEALQAVVVGLFVPAVAAFLVIAIVAGGGPIAHFSHFFAFLFGGAIEAMYVFAGHDSETTDRRVTRPFYG